MSRRAVIEALERLIAEGDTDVRKRRKALRESEQQLEQVRKARRQLGRKPRAKA